MDKTFKSKSFVEIHCLGLNSNPIVQLKSILHQISFQDLCFTGKNYKIMIVLFAAFVGIIFSHWLWKCAKSQSWQFQKRGWYSSKNHAAELSNTQLQTNKVVCSSFFFYFDPLQNLTIVTSGWMYTRVSYLWRKKRERKGKMDSS